MHRSTLPLTSAALLLAVSLPLAPSASAQDYGVTYHHTGITISPEPDPPPVTPPPVAHTGPVGPSGPTTAADRRVYFLHGLAGNQGAWTDANAHVSRTYRVEGQSVDWVDYQNGGLSSASTNVDRRLFQSPSTVAEAGLDPDHTFVIGHSMGGLAAREIVRQYVSDGIPREDYRVNGIVTFATPHDGAAIIDNLALSDDLFSEGCTALVAGPREQALQADPGFVFGWIIRLLNVDAVIEEISLTLCEGLAPAIGGILVTDRIANPSGLDIGTNTAFMQQLTTDDPQAAALLPRGMIGSREQDPVLWRMLGSQLADVNAFATFGANDDSRIVEAVQDMVEDYEAKVDENEAEAEDFEIWWPIWQVLDHIQKHQRTAEAWQRGVDWLEGVNEDWEAVIGATKRGTRYEIWNCDCSNTERTGTVTAGSKQACLNYGCQDGSFVEYHYDKIELGNDGVVVLDSQIGWDGAPKLETRGSNHFQIRNDENTALGVRWIFEGDEVENSDRLPDFFLTERRNP